MNITDARYLNDSNGNPACIIATIDGTESYVPIEPDNSHYAEILRRSQEGSLTISPDTENLFMRMEAGELAVSDGE